MIRKKLINVILRNEIGDLRCLIKFKYRLIRDLIMKIYAEKYDDMVSIIFVESVTKRSKKFLLKMIR